MLGGGAGFALLPLGRDGAGAGAGVLSTTGTTVFVSTVLVAVLGAGGAGRVRFNGLGGAVDEVVVSSVVGFDVSTDAGDVDFVGGGGAGRLRPEVAPGFGIVLGSVASVLAGVDDTGFDGGRGALRRFGMGAIY